jgi:hypothetical protein
MKKVYSNFFHLCRRTHGWDSYATPLMLISVEGDSGPLQNKYPYYQQAIQRFVLWITSRGHSLSSFCNLDRTVVLDLEYRKVDTLSN